MKRNNSTWKRAWGRWTLGVDGAVDLCKATRCSAANWNEKNGVLELYAFFPVGNNDFNENDMRRELAPELSKLFKASPYLCVIERGTHQNGDNMGKRICKVNFYGMCQRPEPDSVGSVKSLVFSALRNLQGD